MSQLLIHNVMPIKIIVFMDMIHFISVRMQMLTSFEWDGVEAGDKFWCY